MKNDKVFGTPASVKRTRDVARVVEIVGWISLFISVLAGAALWANGLGGEDGNDELIAFGLAVAIGGGVQSLLVVMVAGYVTARMDLARMGLDNLGMQGGADGQGNKVI